MWKHVAVHSAEPKEITKVCNDLEAEGYDARHVLGTGASTSVLAHKPDQADEVAARMDATKGSR